MAADPAPPPDLPRWRRGLVTFGVVAFLLGSGFDVATGREHWPFSPYSMYSRIKPDYESRKFFAFATTADGRTISLDSRRELAPFDRIGLHMAVLLIRRDHDEATAAEMVREIVQEVADRYERRRVDGSHDGPELREVRLERLVWEMDPQLRNLDAPEERSVVVTVVPNVEARDD